MKDLLKLNDMIIIQELAKTGSVSLAAVNLGLAQANMSRMLHQLESRIGVKIFDRDARPLRLTTFGHDILPHIDRVLANNELLKLYIHNHKKSPGGVVNIHLPIFAQTLLSLDFIPRFSQEHQDIKLVFTTRSIASKEYFEGVKYPKDCDILITFTSPTDENLIARKLLTMELSICANKDFIADKKISTLQDLQLYPWVLQQAWLNDDYCNPISLVNKKTDEKTSIVTQGSIVCDNFLSAIHIATHGMGFVLVPKYIHVNYPVGSQLVPVLMGDYSINLDIFMVYRKRELQPYRLGLVVDAIFNNVTGLYQQYKDSQRSEGGS